MTGASEPSPKPLDWALAMAVLVPVVLAPAYFFARMEAAREQALSEEWRGLALARGLAHGGLDPGALSREATLGLQIVFSATQGGVDEFGIAKDSRLAVTDSRGTPLDAGSSMNSSLREATGVVRSLPADDAGTCTSGDGAHVICGVRTLGGVSGVVMERADMGFSPFVLLAILFLGTVTGFLAARRLSGRVLPLAITTVGAGTTLVGAASLAWGTASLVDASGILESILAGQLGTAAGQLPLHDTATGAGFVLFATGATAGLVFCLAGPTARLLGNLRDRPLVYAAIAPAMVGMILLIFVPFLMGVYLAFMDGDRNFVGLANFTEILFPGDTADTNFYLTLGVTILWTSLNVSLHVAIGLALALVLSDSKLRGRSWFRVLLIVPWAIPNYITALIWKWIFNTQYGPANAFLALLGMDPVDWLGRSFITNFTANLATNVWLGFPFMMVVALGALQSIPKDLYEAAEMDGAGRWARFCNVTLPLLKPALFPAIILGTIWTFNMFNVVYLVSGGAPDNQTNILITEAYRAFRVLKNFGMAAAYSLIIFVILAVYTALTNRMTKAAENVFE
ncbi:MAG: sugar ABC transporter permease [Deltaproteobacteria bacterium]|nr:sugar ABC transporter permease [Deltaproteobacteria bacterium]